MSPTTALVPLDGESLPTHAESSSLPALLAQPHALPIRCVASTPGHIAFAVSGGTYVHACSARPGDAARAEAAMRRAIEKNEASHGVARTASSDLRAAFGSGEFGGVVDGAGDSLGGDDQARGDSQLSFHGASPVVKLMFLPGDDSRDVPCVLVAVQENGAVAAWCRVMSRGDDDDDVRWMEMAEPTVPGGPPEIAPPLRGYRKGAHGAVIDAALAVTEAEGGVIEGEGGVTNDGGKGGVVDVERGLWGGCVVRVVTLVDSTPSSVDPSSGDSPSGDSPPGDSSPGDSPPFASLIQREVRVPSVETVVRRATRSPFSFVRDATRTTTASTGKHAVDGDGIEPATATIAAEYPGAIALLGAGGSDLWVVCAGGGGKGGGGGHGREGKGGGGGGGGIRRANGCEAYRWNAALGVATARVNVVAAAAAADSVAARIDGDREWDEKPNEASRFNATPAVALTAPGRELLAVTPRGEVIAASPPLERCPVGSLPRHPRPVTSGGSGGAPEAKAGAVTVAWRHLATLGGFREERPGVGRRGPGRWACVGSVAARGSFIHIARCHDDDDAIARGGERVAPSPGLSGLDAVPGYSRVDVTTYHLSTGAAVGTAPMPSLPPPRGSRAPLVDDDDAGRDGRRNGRRGLVVVAPVAGDFPEILVTAYESGGTAGLFRLEQRVPASLAASIDAVIDGSLFNGSLKGIDDGSPFAFRRAARTLRSLASECAGWGGSAEGARRRASLALAELEAAAAARGIELDDDDDDGDDDVGGGALSAGGTLRAALLLRERDAVNAVNAESWRSAAAKCVESVRNGRNGRAESVRSPASSSPSFEAYVPSSADARVVEDALRDAEAVDDEKYPGSHDDEGSGEISESKWKRLGTPAGARRLDPTEWDDATWYDLHDDVPTHADVRVGLAVMESAEAASALAVPESKALDADDGDALLKCRNAIHLATQAARARTEPTAALSAGSMFDNHAAETVADLCDGSFDGGRVIREKRDEFDDAFRLAIGHISRATIGAEERVADSARGGKTAHSSTDRDYGVFESTCAVLHACWPRALPSFARAYAFNKGVDAKTVATIALRRLAPTKLELSDKAGGVSCVARACLLRIAGHTRVATWMLLTGVRCVNDPEAALNEMMERCARVNADDAGEGEKEKEKSTKKRPTLVRHSSEEDDSSDSSDDDASGDDDDAGDGAPMSARAFAAFGGSSTRAGFNGRERLGKEPRSTPLGWRLATELLRACASIDDVDATADVFDVLRASFTASAGAASAWSAQSPRGESQSQSQSQSQSPTSAAPPKCVDVAEDGLCTAEGAAAAFLAAAGVLARCWAGGAVAEAARAFEKLTDVDPDEGIYVPHDAPREVTWDRGKVDALERLAGEAARRLREMAARVRA